MKKIIATALSLIMVLSFAGCGETKKAEEAVTNLFEAFKAGDFEKAPAKFWKKSRFASQKRMFWQFCPGFGVRSSKSPPCTPLSK